MFFEFKLRKIMKAIYLSPKGTFSEKALMLAWGAFSLPGAFNKVKWCPAENNRDVLSLLKKSKVPAVAILAMHTLANGRLTASFEDLTDLCDTTGTGVVGAIEIPISFALLAWRGRKKVQGIIAHKEGIAACQSFIKSLKVKVKEADSNALAAKLVSQAGAYELYGALASADCASIYNLGIIRERCEDSEARTMFYVLKKDLEIASTETKEWRAVFVLDLKNVAGALVQVLLPFEKAGINMVHIHPMYARNGNYRFLIEVEGSQSDHLSFDDAVAQIRALSKRLSVFGPFPLVRL